MKFVHMNGKSVEISGDGFFAENLTPAALEWWMTRTSRSLNEATAQVDEILTKPEHPQYHFALEFLVLRVKERLLK